MVQCWASQAQRQSTRSLGYACSFERGDWQPSPKSKSEITRFAAIAAAALTKDKRVNIHISSRDLDDIQAKAAE